VGRGLAASSPRTPGSPEDKFLAMAMGSVSNQNCHKGFSFKEKVEKHCCKW